jgi:rubrerythrin
MPKRSDARSEAIPVRNLEACRLLVSEKNLEFSFLTQNAPSHFVILEEKKKYAGGSVWRCSGCRGTFDHKGVPTYCALCWKMASAVKRLENDQPEH